MKTNKLYIGTTSNLEKRLKEHNCSKSKYTKNRGPWELIYSEEYATRSQAVEQERFLKTGKGREYLRTLLENLSGCSAVG